MGQALDTLSVVACLLLDPPFLIWCLPLAKTNVQGYSQRERFPNLTVFKVTVNLLISNKYNAS